MITTNDWKGFHNVLKGLEFNEDDFTFSVLSSFIATHQPKVNIQEFQHTKEIEDYQNALKKVLECAKIENYVKNYF